MTEQTPQTPQPEKPEQEQIKEQAKEQAKYDSRQHKEDLKEAKYQRREERREYRNGRSVSDGLGVGVTFIFIGVVWMMAKLGYLNFSIIGALVDLWPLIFVVIGLNILFRKVPYIGLITWVTFLSAIVGYGIYFAPQDNWISWQGDNSFTINNTSTPQVSGNVPMVGNEQVKNGQLELNLSAGNLMMGASESNLIDYTIPQNYVDTEVKVAGETAKLTFSEKRKANIVSLKGKSSDYDFYLNKAILWDISVNVGAADSEMDFTNVPIKDLEINGGAGDFQLTLGELQDKSNVSVNMAAGAVDLTVPENVGLKIVTNGLISDQNFEDQGLTKMDGSFQTSDYDTAAKVIYIEINSAVSDLTLNRK